MILSIIALVLSLLNLFIGLYINDYLFIILFFFISIFIVIEIFYNSIRKMNNNHENRVISIIKNMSKNKDNNIYVHKKTGNKYVLDDIIINKTDNLDNEYVLYHKLTDRTKKYCRCKKEFKEKFYYEYTERSS